MDGIRLGAAAKAIKIAKIVPHIKKPMVISIADAFWFNLIRNDAIAHNNPEATPIQSPKFCGIGNFTPSPKIVNIPITAIIIENILNGVMFSFKNSLPKIVPQTGVK